MEEELRLAREDVRWQRDLARLRDEELQALRARVAELEGLRAPGEHAQSSEPSEPSEASKKRAEEVRVLKRDKLMAVIANKSLRAEAERSRDEARDAKHSREMMEALLTENRAERIILGVDKDTATQTPGPPLDESARQGKIMRMMCACACNSSIDKGSLVELGCGHMLHVDCMLMIVVVGEQIVCPQCRRPLAKSDGARAQLFQFQEETRSLAQYRNDEVVARAMARSEGAPQRAASPRVVSPEEQAQGFFSSKFRKTFSTFLTIVRVKK